MLFQAAAKKLEKSTEALLFPQRFKPALFLETKTPFASLWKNKPNWVLANMAHLAYFEPDKIRLLLSPFKPKAVLCYTQKGAEGFLSVWEEMAILSFRGTQPTTLNDLTADLAFYPKKMGQRFGSSRVFKRIS